MILAGKSTERLPAEVDMGLMLIYEKLLKADRHLMRAGWKLVRDYQDSWKRKVVIFVESK
jgi:hypothetical protein